MAISHNSLIIGSYPSPVNKLAPAPLANGNATLRFNTCGCITTTSSCSSRQVVLSALSPASANTTANTVGVHPRLGDDQNDDNPTSLPVASAIWSQFARNVSGEWDGYGADFSREGKPAELPENVVPEAYREWEVKVFDWQIQCPTLAEPEDFVAVYKLIKLLPTVGCEADAATRYSIDERTIGGAANIVSSFAYQSSGGYVAVWPAKDHPTFRLFELEHCLVDPQNRESRVRIIQVLRAENAKLVLQNIKVFVEQWYGPFRNGEQLGGCAIRDSTFAATDALKSSQITGVWQGLNAVARFQNSQNNILQPLLDDSVEKSARDGCNLILLPKNLWCSLKEREDGETCCEVGWLLDQGRAITSKCIFSSNAELKASNLCSVICFLLFIVNMPVAPDFLVTSSSRTSFSPERNV
ncbi:hypothetical protein RJ640_026946 [Escallonia rubra]|uniref:Uncharacterized protein n=1 Tax=Escallonia rubra TaxID=112253 RepID=A0AA88RFH2_9ASTE|nr:hypothetical protein RJ640_026946 [Escallonia rubra]